MRTGKTFSTFAFTASDSQYNMDREGKSILISLSWVLEAFVLIPQSPCSNSMLAGVCWQENLEKATMAHSTAVVCLKSGVQIRTVCVSQTPKLFIQNNVSAAV